MDDARLEGAEGPVAYAPLIRRFRREFEASDALYAFARDNRPAGSPAGDYGRHILMRIYARSSKTFQGSLRLAMIGYGEQASMLNRALFEDMAIGHWVRRHPEDALKQLQRHERYQLGRWGAALRKHDWPNTEGLPDVPSDEQKELGGDFRGKTWTGLTVYNLVKEIEDDWEPGDRELLWTVHDVVYFFSTMLVHQTAPALALVGRDSGEAVTFDVGPSETHVKGALFGAFWAYSQTVSLVLDEPELEQLQKLYSEHVLAFGSFHA